ncbi:MAG TPA: hypothetical protein DIV86_03885 [Alphaproteobacteria bacterium]|nr:hypothetical protein [Alphaproteobacteria bacterium]
MLLEIETSSNPVTVMIFDYNNLHHNSEMRGKMFGLLKELDDVKVYLANTNREERYIDWRK